MECSPKAGCYLERRFLPNCGASWRAICGLRATANNPNLMRNIERWADQGYKPCISALEAIKSQIASPSTTAQEEPTDG